MVVVRKGCRAGAASQPLPGGDPDVRPRLLLDHRLYLVIDLFKAVPFHDSCRQDTGCVKEKTARNGGTTNQNKIEVEKKIES